MTQEAIQYLPVDQIDCNPQVRETIAEQPLTGLARSIQEVGLQQPIRARRVGERFVVVDGERRLRAIHLLKRQEIAAIVEEKDLCPGEVTHRQWVANFQRAGLSPCERARGIKRLMDETGWTATEAAGKCGVSSSTVTRLLAILELPDAIQHRIDAGEVPESAGYLLKQIDDPVRQATLVAQMAEGALSRDALAADVKAESNGHAKGSTKRPNRATALLASGDSVTVIGTELTLERMVEAVAAVLAKIRKLHGRGVDLATACRMIREEAKADAEKASPVPEAQ
jgi:ParB family transcriptional regulator, chromosome partitioning protein